MIYHIKGEDRAERRALERIKDKNLSFDQVVLILAEEYFRELEEVRIRQVVQFNQALFNQWFILGRLLGPERALAIQVEVMGRIKG